jgi:hypothetical protein
VAAQDATPGADEGGPAFLFVQLAEAGAWTPNPDVAGGYVLTLFGASGQSLIFSDRPERIVGTVATDQFLDALGFTPANPPNAALVVKTPDEERDVLVIELFDPAYTEAVGEYPDIVLTYQAQVLATYSGAVLATWSAEQEGELLPMEFTDASLLIDDCPDANPLVCFDVDCNQAGDLGNHGMCWSWSSFYCQPRKGGFDGTSAQCNAKFAACRGQCTTKKECFPL